MASNNVIPFYKTKPTHQAIKDPVLLLIELRDVFTTFELCKAYHRKQGNVLRDDGQLIRDCARAMLLRIRTPHIVTMLQNVITHPKPVEMVAARHGEFLQLLN